MEKEIEKYLVERVKSVGGFCLKLPPTFHAGLPDRLVLLPDGVAVFVETKAKGAKPRPLQLRVIASLRALGHRVEVIDSKDSVNVLIPTPCSR